jgi:rhomboid family GlyGly-CTERM serine protease
MGLRKGGSSHRPTATYSVWLLPIVIVGISGALMLGDDLAREWLRFDRAAIVNGQFWRLLTGHYVHLGVPHFLLNSAGLLLVWYLIGTQFSANQWLLIGAGSIIGIDLGFWLFEPQLSWYVGLSGLLHGLLVAGIINAWDEDRPMASILAVMVVAKLIYEQLAGPLPGSVASSGGSVIVAAHLYGAVGGAFTAVVLALFLRRATQSG